MTKGYWVGQIEVNDQAAYQKYRTANAEAFEKYGARFLVRGGDQTIVEGRAPARTVVIEFKDMETALACYNSPEYQTAKTLRNDPVSSGDLVIVAGYGG